LPDHGQTLLTPTLSPEQKRSGERENKRADLAPSVALVLAAHVEFP